MHSWMEMSSVLSMQKLEYRSSKEVFPRIARVKQAVAPTSGMNLCSWLDCDHLLDSKGWSEAGTRTLPIIQFLKKTWARVRKTLFADSPRVPLWYLPFTKEATLN